MSQFTGESDTPGPMKKLLMVSYLFPPVSGGGVQRTAKFVKYLPEFGWKPVVLTVKKAYDYYSDAGHTADIPGEAEVIRTASLEPVRGLRRLRKARGQAGKEVPETMASRVLSSIRLIRIKDALFVPDTEIGWLPIKERMGSDEVQLGFSERQGRFLRGSDPCPRGEVTETEGRRWGA